jgi:hypothetical protein
VAVNAGGISSKTDDFDRALFGRSVMVLDRQHRPSAMALDPCGVVPDVRSEPPVVDAVLAYVQDGSWRVVDPVMYWHTRSDGALRSSPLELEQRTLPGGEIGIFVQPALREGILQAVGPLDTPVL